MHRKLKESIVYSLKSSFKKKWPLLMYYHHGSWMLKEFGERISFIRDKPFIGFRVKRLLDYMHKVQLRYYTPSISDVIIDIGAGNGDEVLVYSQLVGEQGKIYAIEAHPKTFRDLQNSVKLNNISNTFCFELAISDKNGTLNINNTEDWFANKIEQNGNGFIVKSLTLDDFILQNGIKKIDFLQINIEGAESDAIETMHDTLRITKNIAVSCHDFLFENNTSEIKDKVEKILKDHGFVISYNKVGIPYRDSWLFGRK